MSLYIWGKTYFNNARYLLYRYIIIVIFHKKKDKNCSLSNVGTFSIHMNAFAYFLFLLVLVGLYVVYIIYLVYVCECKIENKKLNYVVENYPVFTYKYTVVVT